MYDFKVSIQPCVDQSHEKYRWDAQLCLPGLLSLRGNFIKFLEMALEQVCDLKNYSPGAFSILQASLR